MPLPWSAPGYSQGIFPAQAPFPGPAPVSPYLIEAITRDRERQQAQTQQAIQQVSTGIAEAMKQRQNDAIASQLLAGSAPQAEAFTPAGEPTPTGTPSAALSPEEMAQNKAMGYPTRQLMTPTQTYSASQQLADQHLKDLYDAARIEHLNRLGYGSAGARGSATADRYVTVQDPQGRTLRVTGNEAAKLIGGGTGFAGAAETGRGWEKPDGTFTNNPADVGLPPNTDANTQGTSVKVLFPRAKSPTVLPAGTWDSLKWGSAWKIVEPVGGGGSAATAHDQRAVEWARANPDDPRSKQILAANGF